MKHLIRPHGIFIGTFNGRPITDEVENSVMSFFFLFMLTFSVLAGLRTLSGSTSTPRFRGGLRDL